MSIVRAIEVKFLELCQHLEDELAELLRRWSLSHNAATTRRDYQRYVYEYIEFIRKSTWREPTIDDLNHSNLCLSYVMYLRKKHTKDPGGGYVGQVALSKMSAVRSLYKLAFADGFIRNNPMAAVPSLKAVEAEPRDIMNEKEVELLLAYMDQKSQEKRAAKSGLRRYTYNMYRTMFYVLLGTGMRSVSIRHLRLKDHKDKRLTIYEKRGKKHGLELNEQTSQMLRGWVQEFRPLARETDYIFSPFRYPLDALSEKGFAKSLKKYVKDAGIEKNVTPHSFRATVVSYLHWQGIKGRRIQALMGHKNYNTTLRYLNRADELHDPITEYLKFGSKNGH